MRRQATITILDRIDVDAQGMASARRIYTFSNEHSSEDVRLPFSLRASFPAGVHFERAWFSSGRRVVAEPSPSAYEDSIDLVIGAGSLAAGQREQLEVSVRWPNFLPTGREASGTTDILLKHDFTCEYELCVECTDPGLLKNALVLIDPPVLRRPNESVIYTSTQGFHLLPIKIPKGQRATASVSVAVGGPPSLPVLETLSNERRAAAPFRNIAVFFIQHLLSDFVSVLDAFKTAGLDQANTFVMGIPYSTQPHVIKRLRARLQNVRNLDDYKNIYSEVKAALGEINEHCVRRGLKFLVVEDGGYVAKTFRDEPEGATFAANCLGIVEQTANGIRVTHDWVGRAAAGKVGSPSVGVVNVAETELKARTESPLIGKAVVDNVKMLMRAYEKQQIDGWKALVVGCGNIGRRIANELVREGCVVTVVDRRPLAELGDIRPEVSYVPLEDLAQVVAGHHLIIGATGNALGAPEPTSVPPFNTAALFLDMHDQVVLVNASSKMAEFNWEIVANIAPDRMSVRAFGHERQLKNGKKLRIAADGFPVNFYNSESAPALKMQPVLAMLFLGACRVLENPGRLGIIEFTAEDQQMIEGLYNTLS